jgi:polysaccharide export outer membrane protein
MKHKMNICCLAAVTVACLAPALPAAAQRVAVPAPRPAATTGTSPKEVDKAALATASLPAVSAEYRLGPGDKLRIEVYKDPQLSQSVQIRPDGKITLPLVGDIDANGTTPLKLRDTIATALKEYMNNPVVTVIVVEATAATAYVMGEVNQSGAVTLQGPLTVLQALALAGGLKDFADAKNIRVLRRTASGTQAIPFNYKEAVKGNAAPVYLQPGDTVVVPD